MSSELKHLLSLSEKLKSDADDGQLNNDGMENDIDFIRAIGLSFVEPDDDTEAPNFEGHAAKVTSNLDEYREAQPKLGNMGILGPEARSKGKGAFVTASALVTQDALELGHEVTREDLKQFYTEDDQKDLFQVPSVYYVDPPEDATKSNKQRWRFIHGPESARVHLDGGASFVPVVLVALTNMVVYFIPHTENEFAAWEKLTAGGAHAPELKGKLNSTALSSDFSSILHQNRGDYALKMEMTPGSRIITHRGMPLFLSAVKEEEEEDSDDDDECVVDGHFVAKTVVAELRQSDDEAMQKILSKRHLTWRLALDKGGWMSAKIDSNISANTITKTTKAPDKPLFQMATYQEMIDCLAMTTLVKSPKGQLPKDPAEIKRKKAEAQKKKAVEEKEDNDGVLPMDVEPEKAEKETAKVKAKKTSSFKPKKKRKKVPAAKDDDVSKETKKSAQPNVKREEVLYKQHDELIERISKIDSNAWNPEFDKAAKGHRAVLKEEEDLTAAETNSFIKKYRASLKTLAKKVDQAEKDEAEVLPIITAQMDEAKEILNHLEINTDNKKIKVSHASRMKELETLTSSYLMRSGKKVELFLKDCKRLQTAVQKASDRKRKREEEAKAKAKANGSLKIPVIDNDDIDEMLCTGSAEIQNTFTMWQGKTDAFRNMVMAMSNDQVTALFETWEEIKQEVIEYVKDYMKNHQDDDPTADNATYDMGKLNAYGHALQYVFDTRGSGKSINGGKKRTTKSKARKIECPHCEEMIKEFEDTGNCKMCFRKYGLRELTLGLEQRAKKLSALADAETTATVEAENKARKALREAGEDSDNVEEKPLGPYQKAWDVWDGYPESPEGDAAVMGLYDRLTEQAGIFDTNKKATNWNKLRELIQEADRLLPRLSPDEDEAYASEDGMDDNDEDIMEWAVDDDAPIEYMSDHENDDSDNDVEIIPTPKKPKLKRSRETTPPLEVVEKNGVNNNGLAHKTLMALKRYKFPKTQDTLLALYPDQPDKLNIELSHLINIKTAFVIDMQWEGDDEVTSFPEYFVSIKEAVSKIKEMTVPGLSCKPRKIQLE